VMLAVMMLPVILLLGVGVRWLREFVVRWL
jgi:hypothetical protein